MLWLAAIPMKADVRPREAFLHARTRNLMQSGAHHESGDGIAFPPKMQRFRIRLRDCRRSHATLCRACAATTEVRNYLHPTFVPVGGHLSSASSASDEAWNSE